MYGGGGVLISVVEALVVAIALGVAMGLVAGYYRGWTDALFARFGDLLFAVPHIIILLLVLTILGNNLTWAMLALGLLLSANFMRLTRSAVLVARTQLYVDSAQVNGLPSRRILLRHILPNIAAPIIVQASVTAGTVLLIVTGLGFLGLGPPPPNPNWGAMVQDASENIAQQPWLMAPTGLAIVLTALAFTYLGDALRDATAGGTRPLVLKPSGWTQRKDEDDIAAKELAAAGSEHGLLELRDVTIAAVGGGKPIPLVDRLNLTVKRGETLAIVGESGCGKTVTALAALGLLTAGVEVVSGEIRYDGRIIADERSAAALRGSHIGWLPQEPMVALDQTFTVQSQLVEPLRIHRSLTRAQARSAARDLLEMVGIADPDRVLRSYPFQLSGGMAQRVCLALALTGQPELLIADEPTTALDVTVQAEILALLRGLQDRLGLTVVIVTHDLGVVAEIASRVLVMYAGQFVENSPVDAIFTQPRHPYTEGLLASRPTLHHADDLAAIPGTVPAPGTWPTGCRFAARCPYATPACSEGPIETSSVGLNHLSRCIHPDMVRPPRDLSEGASRELTVAVVPDAVPTGGGNG
jgi:peptide/nickel transport system permease protein